MANAVLSRQARGAATAPSAPTGPAARPDVAAPPRHTRVYVLVWLAIVALTLGVSVARYDSYQLGTHFDDARYVILARSLISSDRFGMINAPGAPQAERYPFGYPLILSIPLRLVPDNLEAVKSPSLIATIINLALLFWGWRRLTSNNSRWLSLAVVGLYALSPLVTGTTRRAMSEPIFTTFCLIVLLLVQRRAEKSASFVWSAALSLALVLAMFTRDIGVVLVITSFAYLFARLGRQFWREASVMLAQMAAVLLLVLTTTPIQLSDLLPTQYLRDENATLLVSAFDGVASIQTDTSSAVSGAGGVASAQTPASGGTNLVDSWWRTARFYLFKGVRQVAIGIGGGDGETRLAARFGVPQLPAMISVAVVALVLTGLVRAVVRGGGPVSAWYALAFGFALLFWTGKEDRLLYPIAAQIMWGLVAGLELVALGVSALITRRTRTRLASAAVAAVVTVLAAGSLWESSRLDDSRWHTGDLTLRTSWLIGHGSPNDVVMTEAPEADFLYGGHKTVTYPDLARNRAVLQDYLRTWNVKYVLVAPAVEWRVTYSSTYSPDGKAALDQLQTLVDKGDATLAYDSGDGIQVFDVGYDAT